MRFVPTILLLMLALLLLGSPTIAQTTAPIASAPIASSPIASSPATASPAEPTNEHDEIRHGDNAGELSFGTKTSAPNANQSATTLDMRRVTLALGIVLGLVFACRWAARWMFPSARVGRSSEVMKILSRSVIAPKQQLLLIQVGKRLVLVGDCGQQMNALAEISDPDEVAGLLGQLRATPAESQIAKPFAPLLGRAQRDFDDNVPPAIEPEDEEDQFAVAGVDQTRGELSGLSEKIRMLSRHLGKM